MDESTQQKVRKLYVSGKTIDEVTMLLKLSKIYIQRLFIKCENDLLLFRKRQSINKRQADAQLKTIDRINLNRGEDFLFCLENPTQEVLEAYNRMVNPKV